MKKIRVVVVDDHPLFRQGVCDILRSDPTIEIISEAGDGQTGLEQTRQLTPDVLVLDINLPRMNGLQVTRQLRTEHHPTAIILLTAYDDTQQISHAFKSGCAAYCPKDINPQKLPQVVHLVAQGHYVFGDQVFDAEGLHAWLDRNMLPSDTPVEKFEPISPLSAREMEILQCVTRGQSNKEIAQSLGISHQTVKNHMTAILTKLKLEDRTQAAVFALRRGWVRLHAE